MLLFCIMGGCRPPADRAEFYASDTGQRLIERPTQGGHMIAQYDEPIPDTQTDEIEIGAGRSVLIVDDDQDLAESLALGLNSQGFLTTLAERADLALQLARTDRPDVILLDYSLPDMNGFEVCRRLDENRATSSIPVIMLSGSVEGEMIRRARSAGCRFYLQKPYDPNALLTLIGMVLSDAA
jgi:CheY-like chemotaxis protein